MATNFPSSLDSLTNPTSTDTLASPSHSAQHANSNDAIEALQAKVGVNNSAVTTSLDYLVRNINASTAIISGSSAGDLVRITQTGAGNALVVEDSANPDSTPFVITSSGIVKVLTPNSYSNLNVDGSMAVHGANTTLNFVDASNTRLGYLNHSGAHLTLMNQAANGWTYLGTDSANRVVISPTGNVGIGTGIATNYNLGLGRNITGGTTSGSVMANGQVQSDVTNNYFGFQSAPSFVAGSYTTATVSHFTAAQGTLGAGATINTQIGFRAFSSLSGATNNFGFYGDVPNNSGNYNLYMYSAAPNYFAGSLGIGSGAVDGYTIRLAKAITGLPESFGVYAGGAIQSDVTTGVQMFSSGPSVANSVTAPIVYHFTARGTTLGTGSAITTQAGFVVASALTQGTNNYGFLGALAAGTGRYNLYMSGTADNYLAGSLGIGNTSLTGRRLVVGGNLTGAVASVGLSVLPTIQSDVTTSAYLVNTVGVTTASAFTLDSLHHFRADQQAFGAGSTVNTQYGFIVGATLVGATTNYGFYSNIPVGTGRWNLYMNGTADNYMAGRLGVGATLTSGAMMRVTNTTAADIALAVRGAAAQTGNLFEVQNSSGTGLMGVDDTGSLGIGTVNPVTLEGRRLLVTGSLTGKTTSVGVLVYPTVQSDVTTAYVVNTNGITAATAFTLGALHHFRADQGTFGAGSTVTDQIGFIAGSSLTGATNNFGFYGNIASGTGRWNLYMAGTAANYIAGRLGIGATLTSGAMAQITNTTAADNALVIKGASSQSGLLLDIENSAGTTLVSVSASGTILTRAGSTQDGVALAGRAGGTGDYEVTLTPTTLTADRTLTLPDVTGTAITTGNLSSITSVGTLTNVLESQGQNIYISGSTGSFVQHTTNTGSGDAAEWSIAFGAAVLIRNTSTRDDKENIQPLNGVLTPSMIDQIDVSLWTRKNSPDFPEVGPMAEDMDSISPFLATHGMNVDENENIVCTPPNGINRNAWMSLLTIALQDCRRRIEELESR